MVRANIIQDVEHKGTVAGAKLIYCEVMEWIAAQFVIGNKITCNSFPIMWSKELSGCVPELTGVVWGLSVEFVFKLRVTSAQVGVKSFFVRKRIEIKRSPRRKDGDIFGEVSVIGIVETVFVVLTTL